jgi:peptidyl-prolyl cis-trans isomerase A (cyclophilin A)
VTARNFVVLGLSLAAMCLAAGGCKRQAGQTGPASPGGPTGAEGHKDRGMPIVAIETSAGTIKAELWPDKSPISVDNFLKYASAGRYDGTIFHRCLRGFMIQCGEFPPGVDKKPDRAPIKNEAANGVQNRRGTLAMARTPAVDSATAQFFINTVDNPNLDHGVNGFGYAVFGAVTEGMDVVLAIERAPIVGKAELGRPANPVTIKSIRILSGAPKPLPE